MYERGNESDCAWVDQTSSFESVEKASSYARRRTNNLIGCHSADFIFQNTLVYRLKHLSRRLISSASAAVHGQQPIES